MALAEVTDPEIHFPFVKEISARPVSEVLGLLQDTAEGSRGGGSSERVGGIFQPRSRSQRLDWLEV